MPAFCPPVSLRRVRRALLAFVAVLVLLLQPWVGTNDAVAMAMGTEICTTSGTQLIDATGKAVDSAKHGGHDCCCSGAASLPGGIVTAAAGALRHPAPAAVLAVSRLDAEWLAPLSRGPPPALRS